MNVIETTLKYYPKMAWGGWCFAGNCTVSGESDSKLDLEDPVAVRDHMIRKIAFYSHMGADACLIGFGCYKAFWDNGHHDPTMVPTFIKVNDKGFLSELQFCSRDPEIEKEASHIMASCFEITRFELMEID